MENKVTCLSKWSVISFAVLAFTESLLIPLVVYRICYQSTSAFVPSQCVNCPFLALQGYSFSCFGNTAFPRNMTPSQAQCMIQRCQNETIHWLEYVLRTFSVAQGFKDTRPPHGVKRIF
ncbi:uncharacterized protein LOC118189630 [Stegodyphus dumicola]|uniref:uncharacterized protein LOC118189630 n=1 Tax=Stegodyphus dumicola TaxID=202533 RepID=UPI0015AB64D3|nr:uncharacterized protein LOC118189630 [Stegodyphus dumicola]